jgi:TusA-related sulfurtransferase
MSTPALEIDTSGLRCPLPVLALARRILEIPIGETIAMTSDDPAAGPDVHAWARMTGHTFLAEEESGTGKRFLVRRETTQDLTSGLPEGF